jgi:RNA 3'-phosphate cyclase
MTIKIDGSHGEGGGQIIRTSISLAAVTGKPCRIDNIRAGRCNPGLQAQHLAGINTVARLCNGKLKGNNIGSTEIEFIPGRIKGGDYKINVGTAGAITLVLQSVVIPCLHADHEVNLELTGGTHVRWSPSMEFFHHIFCSFMEKIGITICVDVKKYGFYPKGGGLVFVNIKPTMPRNIEFTERGKFITNHIWSYATNDLKKSQVAERQLSGAEEIMKFEKKNTIYVPSLSTGSLVHTNTCFENCRLAGEAIGERGKKAEEVGRDAAVFLKKQLDTGAPVDEHMADQLLPFMALASSGKIHVAEITNHAKTNISVIEKFLDVKFIMDEKNKIIKM